MWCGQEGPCRTQSADPTLRKGIRPPPAPHTCMCVYTLYVNRMFKAYTYIFSFWKSFIAKTILLCDNKQQPQCQWSFQTSTWENPTSSGGTSFLLYFRGHVFTGLQCLVGPNAPASLASSLPLECWEIEQEQGGRPADVKTSDCWRQNFGFKVVSPVREPPWWGMWPDHLNDPANTRRLAAQRGPSPFMQLFSKSTTLSLQLRPRLKNSLVVVLCVERKG